MDNKLNLKVLQRGKFERCLDVPMRSVPSCQTYQSMMFSAFRYALKRHSYIVGVTVDWLVMTIETFDKKWLLLFIKEIDEYLEWYDDDPKKSGEFECDIESWKRLKAVAKERLAQIEGK